MTLKLCMMLMIALMKDCVDVIQGSLHSFEKSSTCIKPMDNWIIISLQTLKSELLNSFNSPSLFISNIICQNTNFYLEKDT